MQLWSDCATAMGQAVQDYNEQQLANSVGQAPSFSSDESDAVDAPNYDMLEIGSSDDSDTGNKRGMYAVLCVSKSTFGKCLAGSPRQLSYETSSPAEALAIARRAGRIEYDNWHQCTVAKLWGSYPSCSAATGRVE